MNQEELECLATASFRYHEQRDEVSAEDYRIQNRVRLAMEPKQRLYLDTNYWLRLRDCVLGIARSAEDSELLGRLRESVANRTLLVPATEHIVEETLRQRDERTRAATAYLIQELSRNVAIVGFKNRAVTEFIYWISSFCRVNSDTELDAGVFIWSWATALYGERIPQARSDDPVFSNRLEKVAEDLAASQPIAEMIMQLPFDETAQDGPRDLAGRQNVSKKEVWDSSQPFSEVLLAESVGFIDLIWPDLCEHALKWVERMPLLKGDEDGEELQEHLRRLVVSSIQLEQLGSMMPGMQILAGGNAAIRSSEGRKFKPGDFEDLRHATAALPYCDVFATDRSNKHLLAQLPLNLCRRFSCKIVSTVDELLEVIENGS